MLIKSITLHSLAGRHKSSANIQNGSVPGRLRSPMQCTQANELWMALTHSGSEGHKWWLVHCIQLSCWESGRRCAPASSSLSDEEDGKYGIEPLLERSSDTKLCPSKKVCAHLFVYSMRGGYIIKSVGKKNRGHCFVFGDTMAKESLWKRSVGTSAGPFLGLGTVVFMRKGVDRGFQN